MVIISNLRACKDCGNVFSSVIGNIRTSPAKCPVCKSTSNEPVYGE